MPPDPLITDALLVAASLVSIAASIWWAQRDRTVAADMHWGRKEDKALTKLKQKVESITERLKRLELR